MRLRYLCTAALFLLFIVTGCDSAKPVPGDTLIPPVPAAATQSGYSMLSNMNSSNSVNTLANISSDKAYALLDVKNAPKSVIADSRYLYLLDGDGSSIKVFDIENESLVREIRDKTLKDCTAFTVRDSNIYAFDADSGKILLFSSGGSLLSSFDTGLAGNAAEKIIAARDRLIIMKIRGRQEQESQLAVLDTGSGAVVKVDGASLLPTSGEKSPEINDICLYGENSVLVGISPGKLVLYDAEGNIVEKSCSFPPAAGFMEYDGNVLYYSYDGAIMLVPGNAANFSNTGRGRSAGRILMNADFDWPGIEDGLGKWSLDNLNIPYAADGRHYSMAQNSKYLFFLDLVPTGQGSADAGKGDTGKGGTSRSIAVTGTGQTGFMLYRISK